MANWINARLLATGPRDSVLAFAAAAHDETKRVFRADMLVGEAVPVRRDRAERVDDGLYRKRFLFQVRNDTGEEHFTRVSKRYRRLSFVLVYGDPNGDAYGSALIARGERQEYVISARQAGAIWRKHKVTLEDDDEWRFWEASWELMDLAEAKWTSLSPHPTSQQRLVRPPSIPSSRDALAGSNSDFGRRTDDGEIGSEYRCIAPLRRARSSD